MLMLDEPTPAMKAPAPVRASTSKAKDQHSTTIYMPREPVEKLRHEAFARRQSINSLVKEALDLLFENNSYAERCTLKNELGNKSRWKSRCDHDQAR